MDIMEEIKQKLGSGQSPADLIGQGYKRSTVYALAAKLKKAGQPGPGVDDELAELRRTKERVKLEKEIAELEAGRDKLPDRILALEKRFDALCELVESFSDSISMGMWIRDGMVEQKARKEATGLCRKTWPELWQVIDGKG